MLLFFRQGIIGINGLGILVIQYISHLLVFNFVNYALLKSGVSSKLLIAAVTVFVTILLSMLLIKFVANPVEAYRTRIRAEGKAISSS